MTYTPHTPSDIAAMTESIGVASMDELFRDVPAEIMLKEPLALDAMNEYQLVRYFECAAAQNRSVDPGRLFLGAGGYQHYIPAAVKTLMQRGEFVTSYTPYQAEVSQGTLQAIFEFQSHVCALTGMEAANASMYDGATALAEALVLAVRHTGRRVVLLPELLHPSWLAVCRTFMREMDVEIHLLPARDGRTMFHSELTQAAAVVVQTPNVLGVLEQAADARQLADATGALLIAACNPVALSVITPPGAFGADIAVFEAQPLGIPLQFGGPWCGAFACRKSLIRKMPGRVVGRTADAQGREGFVLTLQTREQHIRREKATSNICTNQGLFALMVTMYLTFVGKHGLEEVAATCMARTRQLVEGLTTKTPIRLAHPDAPYFHEVALELPIAAEDFCRAMREDHDIVAGLPLGRFGLGSDRSLLVCATELMTPEDIATYVRAARAILTENR